MDRLLLLLAALFPLFDNRPHPTDALRFPPADVCRAMLAANREYVRFLESRLAWEPYRYWELRGVIVEAELLRDTWDWALTVAGGYPGWTPVMGLVELRKRLAPEAYWSGSLPPCIPLERFVWQR